MSEGQREAFKMASQWKETCFLASPSNMEWQVPIDVAIEQPEEELDFLFGAAAEMKPSAESSSSSDSNSDSCVEETNVTVIKASDREGIESTENAGLMTLEAIQQDLYAMHRETMALKDLLEGKDISESGNDEELNENWQEGEAFVSGERRGNEIILTAGMTTTTSRVLYHEEYVEEVVTNPSFRQPKLKKKTSTPEKDLSPRTDSSFDDSKTEDLNDSVSQQGRERSRGSYSSYKNMIESMNDTESEEELSEAEGQESFDAPDTSTNDKTYDSSLPAADVSVIQFQGESLETDDNTVTKTEYKYSAMTMKVDLNKVPSDSLQDIPNAKQVIDESENIRESNENVRPRETVVKPYLETNLDSIACYRPYQQWDESPVKMPKLELPDTPSSDVVEEPKADVSHTVSELDSENKENMREQEDFKQGYKPPEVNGDETVIEENLDLYKIPEPKSNLKEEDKNSCPEEKTLYQEACERENISPQKTSADLNKSSDSESNESYPKTMIVVPLNDPLADQSIIETETPQPDKSKMEGASKSKQESVSQHEVSNSSSATSPEVLSKNRKKPLRRLHSGKRPTCPPPPPPPKSAGSQSLDSSFESIVSPSRSVDSSGLQSPSSSVASSNEMQLSTPEIPKTHGSPSVSEPPSNPSTEYEDMATGSKLWASEENKRENDEVHGQIKTTDGLSQLYKQLDEIEIPLVPPPPPREMPPTQTLEIVGLQPKIVSVLKKAPTKEIPKTSSSDYSEDSEAHHDDDSVMERYPSSVSEESVPPEDSSASSLEIIIPHTSEAHSTKVTHIQELSQLYPEPSTSQIISSSASETSSSESEDESSQQSLSESEDESLQQSLKHSEMPVLMLIPPPPPRKDPEALETSTIILLTNEVAIEKVTERNPVQNPVISGSLRGESQSYMLDKFENIDIPGIPPPPPRQPPPTPTSLEYFSLTVQKDIQQSNEGHGSTQLHLVSERLLVEVGERIVQTSTPPPLQPPTLQHEDITKFIDTSESEHSMAQFSDIASKDSDMTPVKNKPTTQLQTDKISHRLVPEFSPEKILSDLQRIEVPEVPPPPPRAPPPSMQPITQPLPPPRASSLTDLKPIKKPPPPPRAPPVTNIKPITKPSPPPRAPPPTNMEPITQPLDHSFVSVMPKKATTDLHASPEFLDEISSSSQFSSDEEDSIEQTMSSEKVEHPSTHMISSTLRVTEKALKMLPESSQSKSLEKIDLPDIPPPLPRHPPPTQSQEIFQTFTPETSANKASQLVSKEWLAGTSSSSHKNLADVSSTSQFSSDEDAPTGQNITPIQFEEPLSQIPSTSSTEIKCDQSVLSEFPSPQLQSVTGLTEVPPPTPRQQRPKGSQQSNQTLLSVSYTHSSTESDSEESISKTNSSISLADEVKAVVAALSDCLSQASSSSEQSNTSFLDKQALYSATTREASPTCLIDKFQNDEILDISPPLPQQLPPPLLAETTWSQVLAASLPGPSTEVVKESPSTQPPIRNFSPFIVTPAKLEEPPIEVSLPLTHQSSKHLTETYVAVNQEPYSTLLHSENPIENEFQGEAVPTDHTSQLDNAHTSSDTLLKIQKVSPIQPGISSSQPDGNDTSSEDSSEAPDSPTHISSIVFTEVSEIELNVKRANEYEMPSRANTENKKESDNDNTEDESERENINKEEHTTSVEVEKEKQDDNVEEGVNSGSQESVVDLLYHPTTTSDDEERFFTAPSCSASSCSPSPSPSPLLTTKIFTLQNQESTDNKGGSRHQSELSATRTNEYNIKFSTQHEPNNSQDQALALDTAGIEFTESPVTSPLAPDKRQDHDEPEILPSPKRRRISCESESDDEGSSTSSEDQNLSSTTITPPAGQEPDSDSEERSIPGSHPSISPPILPNTSQSHRSLSDRFRVDQEEEDRQNREAHYEILVTVSFKPPPTNPGPKQLSREVQRIQVSAEVSDAVAGTHSRLMAPVTAEPSDADGSKRRKGGKTKGGKKGGGEKRERENESEEIKERKTGKEDEKRKREKGSKERKEVKEEACKTKDSENKESDVMVSEKVKEKKKKHKKKAKENMQATSNQTSDSVDETGERGMAEGGMKKKSKSKKKDKKKMGKDKEEGGTKKTEDVLQDEEGKRGMMEFYVSSLHQHDNDSDSDSTSATTSTTSSSDAEDDEDEDGRSYQVTAPDAGLATIEEDAEEEDSAEEESSGHWVFSADNTDTESVIHVPAALEPLAAAAHNNNNNNSDNVVIEEGESSGSDETLVVEEEAGVFGGGQEVAGNSHTDPSPTTTTTTTHYDSSASDGEGGGSLLRPSLRRRRKPGPGMSGGAVCPPWEQQQHLDDVFDLASLESCESVSGGSDVASSPAHDATSLDGTEVVFNTSATSQPFADTPARTREAQARGDVIGVAYAPASGDKKVSQGSKMPLFPVRPAPQIPGGAEGGRGGEAGHSGPHSIDLFGLPVRWTPPPDTATPEGATQSQLQETGGALKNTKGVVENIIIKDEMYNNSADSNMKIQDQVSTFAPTDEVRAGGVVKVRGTKRQETVNTAAVVGETCGEARHHHLHNLLHEASSLSTPPHLSVNDSTTPQLHTDGADTHHDQSNIMRGSQPAPSLPPSQSAGSEATYNKRERHLKSTAPRSVIRGGDLASGDSDTDTDNTDGDYDEEDHFSAELSLRISSVHPPQNPTSVKSFRSSDILHLIGVEGGGAGPGTALDDASPPASQEGSSPEVPHSLRASGTRSATRSLETLSEDSGLGDKDVRLTPSSPLPAISEATPRPSHPSPPNVPFTSRPRRHEGRHARVTKALSCGDLRQYSDSDSEEESGEGMYGWPARPPPQMLGQNNINNSAAPHQQYSSTPQHHATYPRHPPHRPHAFSGSDGSDEEVRARYTSHRGTQAGHSRPRRHRSFHEAPCPSWWREASQQQGERSVAAHQRPGRRRPQPISVDLAEQFLTQEGLKSPKGKQTVNNILSGVDGGGWRGHQHPGTGGGANSASLNSPANQQVDGAEGAGGVLAGSQIHHQHLPASTLTSDGTVHRVRSAAPTPVIPTPPHTPHQYSTSGRQSAHECRAGQSGYSSSPSHEASTALTNGHYPLSSSAGGAEEAGVPLDMAEGQMRVHTRTYGARGEVEVFLAKSDFNTTSQPPALTPTGGSDPRPGARGVTFSPSVKEVNWRESYYEAEPENEGSGSDIKKVLVVTSESPTPQRVNISPTPPHTPPPNASYCVSSSASDPESELNSGISIAKTNGGVQEHNNNSDVEINGEKSPRMQTPIWQRFKLPKLPSPKSPRPKLPPKPQSLSSKSSDTEGSKPSSPGGESGSSTPSSPDTRPKRPSTSPRFFSWGSKREKKGRPPSRPTVSPPAPPQVSPGQVGELAGCQAGVKGETEPPVSVYPAAAPREACSVSDSVPVSSRPSIHPVPPPVLTPVIPHTLSPVSPHTFTQVPTRTRRSPDTDFSQESGRSPLASATSGDDSSDSAQLHSPRSAVCKPPLPPHLQRPSPQVFHKARLQSARRQYFSQERQVSAPERNSPPRDAPKPRAPSAPSSPEVSRTTPTARYKSGFDASRSLKERFEQFSTSTRAERERLARSTPDLSVIEASVRRQRPRIDSWSQQQQQGEVGSAAWTSDGEAAGPHRGATTTRAAVHERYKSRAQRIYARSRSQSAGVLETDLDTGTSRELLEPRETNIDDLYRDLQHLLDTLPAVTASSQTADKTRAKSLLDLDARGATTMATQLATPARPSDTRAKSMEFLLDNDNKAKAQPPENELMKGTERQLSEAELRVRRSLQRLDVPDWMKNAPPQQQGFLLRRRDYGSGTTGTGGGWSAYSSKTASMTSLGSSRAHTPNTPTKVVIPTRVATRGVGGMGGLVSPASNSSISPSPSDRSGSLFHYPSSRWSTSRLNSGTTTPTGSVTSSRTTATCGRQPYLGWRSQTSLASLAGSQSSLTSSGSYLTAADRLALGITAYSHRFIKQAQQQAQDKENCAAEANRGTQPEVREPGEDGDTNGIQLQVPTDVVDVHSSIKEVTSAIVHYCNESTPSPRASPRGSPRPEGRAPSPRRLVWVESSFVGSRPITSPETPTSSSHVITPTSQLNGHDLVDGGEVTPRPPQPPGEYLLAW